MLVGSKLIIIKVFFKGEYMREDCELRGVEIFFISVFSFF